MVGASVTSHWERGGGSLVTLAIRGGVSIGGTNLCNALFLFCFLFLTLKNQVIYGNCVQDEILTY